MTRVERDLQLCHPPLLVTDRLLTLLDVLPQKRRRFLTL